MAITFDNTDVVTDIFRYDASANTCFGIYYGRINPTKVFDYFDNDATAGDYIAFGWDNGVWHNLTVNVGTALVAANITVAWEYQNHSYQWLPLTNLVDPSNGFQNTGTHTITFDIPSDWRYHGTPITTVGGLGGSYYYYSACYVRCRIVSVTGITEGGANTNVKPTLKDYAIMIDGGTIAPSDLYNADVAGGWGVITNTGNYYNLMANLFIGNRHNHKDNATTATTFYIQNKTFEMGNASRRFMMVRNRNTTFRMGYKYLGADGINYEYSMGSVFLYHNHDGVYNGNGTDYNAWTSATNIYNSVIKKDRGSFNDPEIGGLCEIVNSQLGANQYYFSSAASGILKDTVLDMGASFLHFYQYCSNLAISNIHLTNMGKVEVGATNVVISNINLGTNYKWEVINANVVAYAKDCTFTNIPNQTLYNNTNGEAIVQFTTSFSFLDQAGAALTGVNVKVINGLGTTIFDGVWTTDLILSVYQTGLRYGTSDFNPFTFIITKDGYETYREILQVTAKLTKAITLTKIPTAIYLINGSTL